MKITVGSGIRVTVPVVRISISTSSVLELEEVTVMGFNGTSGTSGVKSADT